MNSHGPLAELSLEELKRGYTEDEVGYTCICCGLTVEKGVIYPEDGRLYEAGRYIRVHLEKEHGSPFDFLIGLDKSVTGLTEVQKDLLQLFRQGFSDAEVQRELGIGSASTIRNHRFALREKERQARVFLALMELYRERDTGSRAAAAAPPRTPTVKAAGSDEAEKELREYFPQGMEGPLVRYPRKEKLRAQVLRVLAERFESGRDYSEKEVNGILEEAYTDYVLLRRELVDRGLLGREEDGSRYWRQEEGTNGFKGGERPMSRRDELKQMAKETKTESGIFLVRNKVNGKVWVESTRNFKTMNGQEFSLRMGSHMNKALLQEYKEFGADAFEFEVAEKLQKKETGFFDEKEELRKLKLKWLQKLQPYGDKGYNSPKEEEH